MWAALGRGRETKWTSAFFDFDYKSLLIAFVWSLSLHGLTTKAQQM